MAAGGQKGVARSKASNDKYRAQQMAAEKAGLTSTKRAGKATAGGMRLRAAAPKGDRYGGAKLAGPFHAAGYGEGQHRKWQRQGRRIAAQIHAATKDFDQQERLLQRSTNDFWVGEYASRHLSALTERARSGR